MNRLGYEMIDYTTMADNSVSPGRYIFFLEIKSINLISEKYLSKIIDSELKAANIAYGRFRTNIRLSEPKVILLRDGTFADIKQILLKKGTSKNQIKVPRVIDDENGIYKFIMSSNNSSIIALSHTSHQM